MADDIFSGFFDSPSPALRLAQNDKSYTSSTQGFETRTGADPYALLCNSLAAERLILARHASGCNRQPVSGIDAGNCQRQVGQRCRW
jgi:hypothetical protein